MILSIFRSATRILKRDTTFLNDEFKKLACLTQCNTRNIHITSNLPKEFRMGRTKVRSQTTKDVVLEGELTTQVSNPADLSVFPDSSIQHALFNGVPYNQVHIVNVKSTPNNTIMSLTNYDGKGILTHSAGCEGFKNTKKGTNIAAQQTAITFATKALERGIDMIRLRIQGIGPGRAGAIKGIQLAGMKVISITDDTRVSWNPPRPRKQRRI